MLAVPAFALSFHLVATVAAGGGGVPRFNVDPTCNAAARSGAQLVPNKDACMRSELGARQQLMNKWRLWPSDDRASCMDLASIGPTQSYVQLLTCLELATDVRNIRSQPAQGAAQTAAQNADAKVPAQRSRRQKRRRR